MNKTQVPWKKYKKTATTTTATKLRRKIINKIYFFISIFAAEAAF